MYTLKGIFPEPKKEQKRNFIKENVKQLKYIQGKGTNEPKFVHTPRLPNGVMGDSSLAAVKSSPSAKSGKTTTFHVGKPSMKKPTRDIKIRKGDMAEFLRRKELRKIKNQAEDKFDDEDNESVSSGRLRDIGCQTIESSLSQKFAEGTKLTVLYPKKENVDESEFKLKASGDSGRYKNPVSPTQLHGLHRGDAEPLDSDRTRAKSSTTPDGKKDKDPYLPPGYQKGVLPKYLRERKEQVKEGEPDESHGVCPPGHVTLPDGERKETLRMLRNSFAELVSELNKMPVRTDTLRMRNRKVDLEKQLAKLEEGIKVFSRPKVFVKIGE